MKFMETFGLDVLYLISFTKPPKFSLMLKLTVNHLVLITLEML
jgi:hypothetical protein